MSAVLIAAATADVLSRDEVKRHLRVEHDDDDAAIDEIIAAVVQSLDPATGGWLGRALRPQTWELQLAGFACDVIELPYPPTIQIVSLKYDDSAGVEQTLVKDTDFRLVPPARLLGRHAVAPLYRGRWPSTLGSDDSVRIRYSAGYAPAVGADPGPAVADQLPAPIKAYLKLVIGTLYANRESAVSARDQVAALPADIMQGLISTYRVFL